jgi:hypothetical protein
LTGYADPELLIGAWIRDTLKVKVWCDPDAPPNAWASAAWVWVQRGQSLGSVPISLDNPLLDCDSFAAKADHARDLGQALWSAMVLQLPRTTFANGVFVKDVTCFSQPRWAPDPKFKRAAAYSVILHGFVTG